MGTVEWTELLRWVPREPKVDSEQEFQTQGLCEVSASAAPADSSCRGSACDGAKAERGKPTLASL